MAAGVFTTTAIKSAPVILSKAHLKDGKAQAVVANSGCANACTGDSGMADAVEMASLVAEKLGLSTDDVLVASTGVTGQLLPMNLIKDGISRIILSSDGGNELARAILTTDTVTKETAISVKVNGSEFTIGGIAKGSGMIHPNMATMFGFLTTDAAVELDFLKSALKKAVDVSFNMITVDGDTSPSDTVLIMANGVAGNEPISHNSQLAGIFQQALDKVCLHLAKSLVRDGEGATRLIEVTVDGALTSADARLAARTIAGSTLVKAAMHGADPNWGRIMMALGQSGIEVVESKTDIYIGDICVAREGKPMSFSIQSAVQILKQNEVSLTVHLNLGTVSATAWGCDLSHEYVTINSAYMT